MASIKIPRSFIVIALIAVFVAGCHKADNSTPIDATLKKYFSYKPGTYWIYCDSLSGQTDSFVVASSSTQTVDDLAGGYNLEIEDIAVYQNNKVNDSVSYVWRLAENGVQFIYQTNDDIVGYTSFFSYPFQQPGQLSPANNLEETKTIGIYSSYFIGNSSYDSVAEIYFTNSTNSYSDTFFINSAVGIAKMGIHHQIDTTIFEDYPINRIWILQRCNIIH